MAEDSLVIRARGSDPGLTKAANTLEDAVWEPFGFLSHTDAHQKYYTEILENYADLQLCLVDQESEEVVALANCVPFYYCNELVTLPQEGWDWLVEVGGTTTHKRRNILGALAVSVSGKHRSRGYARRMIRELKELAVQGGYDAMVVPVRPTSKSEHPLVPMSEYIGWTDKVGRCYDPWLRSHLSEGARVIGPCERSMVVNEHVAFWETWAGRRFERSGEHTFRGALAPVDINLETHSGRYEEPNVWVGYAI